jgi:hypothetical protein
LYNFWEQLLLYFSGGGPKRLQLIDQSRRKHHVGGKLYAIERREVLDMMQRYDVTPIPDTY